MYLDGEEEEEEEDEKEERHYFTRDINDEKVIYPKDYSVHSERRIKKLNLDDEKTNKKVKKPTQIKPKKDINDNINNNNKHLKSKISTRKIIEYEDEDNDRYEDYYTKKIKSKSKVLINKRDNDTSACLIQIIISLPSF